MDNTQKMKEACKLLSDILNDCERLMRMYGCDLAEANEANAKLHPEKYKKMSQYLEDEIN